MDHFEGIIKTLLEQEGYWVRQSFKINLTKQEKRDTGKPSMPRPEIDLLAFKQSRNEILAIEVKSFLTLEEFVWMNFRIAMKLLKDVTSCLHAAAIERFCLVA